MYVVLLYEFCNTYVRVSNLGLKHIAKTQELFSHNMVHRYKVEETEDIYGIKTSKTST